MPADVAIRTEALVRDFDGVRAVDGVDLQIPAGEIYGFLGPNGAVRWEKHYWRWRSWGSSA
jgi:ABC-type branched-subunit amino acid transport system ATPase component